MKLASTSTLFTAGLSGLLLAGTAAQARPMNIDDLFRAQSVGEIAPQPNGNGVAYTLRVPRQPGSENFEDGSAYEQLHLLRDDGQSYGFVTHEANVGSIQWRPDSEAISYLAKRFDAEHQSLYQISSSGGESTTVFDFDTDISSYQWLDGQRLLFLAKPKDESKDEELADKGFKAKVFEEDEQATHLWQVDLSADSPEASKIELPGSASALTVSADGEHIAIATAPSPRIDDYYMNRTIHLLDSSDFSVAASLDTKGKIGHYEFSPNGEHLAVIAGIDRHDPSAGTLMIADVPGGDLTPLTADGKFQVVDVAWRNDDTMLAALHQREGSRIVEMGLDGEVGQAKSFDDLIVGQLAGSGKRIAATASSPAHPSELFVLPRNMMKRATHHNDWLDEVELGEQRSYSYTARDGETVSGVLIEPLGGTDADTPMIMMVHGGPEAHVSNGWVTAYGRPGQIAAGQGYAVFYPNYRGSTGRGVAYAKAHQNDYAGKEFNDLVDAAKALAEDGLIDVDKVGITGGSYGGYASAWAATALSEHFAASVMFVGISDQISKFGTTDIPQEMYLVHSRAWPWEDWMNMLERSPIYHAGNSKTPTLILHGEEDTRVHPSQSMEMYRYLKEHGQAPVRLVTYPGEGHGNRKAAAQLDYARRLMRWMDHYLRGEGGDKPPFDIGLAEDFLEQD